MEDMAITTSSGSIEKKKSHNPLKFVARKFSNKYM
jgi:hypothetical protein